LSICSTRRSAGRPQKNPVILVRGRGRGRGRGRIRVRGRGRGRGGGGGTGRVRSGRCSPWVRVRGRGGVTLLMFM